MMRPVELLRAVCLFLVVSMVAVPLASAHEVRPAFLEISQSAGDSYRVVWKQRLVAWSHSRMAVGRDPA